MTLKLPIPMLLVALAALVLVPSAGADVRRATTRGRASTRQPAVDVVHAGKTSKHPAQVGDGLAVVRSRGTSGRVLLSDTLDDMMGTYLDRIDLSHLGFDDLDGAAVVSAGPSPQTRPPSKPNRAPW